MTKNRIAKKTYIYELPEIPTEATSSDGYRFRTDCKTWMIQSASGKLYFNFSRFPQLSDELLHSLKLLVIWYIEHKAARTARNAFGHVLYFVTYLAETNNDTIHSFTPEDILNYRSSSNKAEEKLSWLAGVLKKWKMLGLPGVGDDTTRLLGSLRIRGNEKGKAVKTMDPLCGPFSDIELEAIHSAVNRAYADGTMQLTDYVLVWLYFAIGARPIQYSLLKVKDFTMITGKDGVEIYIIRVPRAKQRGSRIRTLFTERRLEPHLGRLVALHIETLKNSRSCQFSSPDEIPLFPTKSNHNNIPDLHYHHSADELTILLKGILGRLNIKSERTGKKINITSRRFRYTIGTRAALEGSGELVIAELLDHSDTQSAGIYVEARPEMVERIDKALALKLAPMAQAFCGMLVTNENEAKRGADPASRIVDPYRNPRREPVGSCGKHGFCGFAAPVSCYTCTNFQPWLDGPHEAVLDRLIQEREDIIAKTGDLRIATVNERTIIAVADVVLRCNAIKAAQAD